MSLAGIIFGAFVAVAPNQATPQELEQVRALLDQRDYDGAVRQLRVAHARSGDPNLLYMEAEIERRRADCPTAIPLYERFLATEPAESDRRNASASLEACRRAVGDSGQAKASSDPKTPTQQAPPPPVPAKRDEARAKRWYTDPWGGALLGVGVATTVTGLGLYLQALADERAAQSSDATLDDYEERFSRATPLSIAGTALMATGGALLVGAIVRYAIVGRPSKRKVAAGPGGVSIRF